MDSFLSFLATRNMSIFFDNNICWDYCYIGTKVDDYDKVNPNYNDISKFCREYELPGPTYYAGIYGELE
jgi:hypothetical protein